MSTGVRRAAEDLPPGYFALVMATGIVSVATWLLDIVWIAVPLLWINVAAFAILWALTLGRLIFYPRRVLADIASHQSGPGFFTLVAGTCVLGTQVLLLTGEDRVAWVLWALGLLLWLWIVYAFFTAVTIKLEKPPLADGINGSWLIAAVATQSVSILGSLLVPVDAPWREHFLFLTLCLYLVGCMLYLVLITLIFYRFTFLPLGTAQLTPPYWINMGAVAITTLSGAILMQRVPDSVLLTWILPFLGGFTLFFWAWGTWWIPLLLILGFWRHVMRGYPLTYDPQYWGLVFPLGMYTTCTIRLSQALDAPFLMIVPRLFVWIAIAAWTVTFIAMLRSLLTPRAS